MSTDPAQMRAHSSTPAAQRMRAYRRRRREGSFFVACSWTRLKSMVSSGESSCGLGSAKIPKPFRWPSRGSSIRSWKGCDRDTDLRLVDSYSNADRLSGPKNAAATVTPAR